MVDEMKRLIKKSYQLLFIVFIGLGLSIGVVYAASTYNAKDIYYHKGSSSLSSDNLQGVIDELYSNSSSSNNDKLTTYAFGLPTASDPIDFQDVIASSGSNVFIQKQGTQLSVCLYHANKLFCMKPGTDDYDEKKAILLNTSTFPGASCSSDSDNTYCEGDDVACYVLVDGSVIFFDNNAGVSCWWNDDNDVGCG